MDKIANDAPRGKSATGQAENPKWIVWGQGRRMSHDWATVHALMIDPDRQWAFVRLGCCLIGFPADTQEGTA